MKVQGLLIQARFIEIHQVFAKKKSDSFVTEQYNSINLKIYRHWLLMKFIFDANIYRQHFFLFLQALFISAFELLISSQFFSFSFYFDNLIMLCMRIIHCYGWNALSFGSIFNAYFAFSFIINNPSHPSSVYPAITIILNGTSVLTHTCYYIIQCRDSLKQV